MWVNLHTHSHYSFLRGLPAPLELAQAAVNRQMPALALTDTGMLTGAVEFYDACRSQGIRAIIGLELPVEFIPEDKATTAARHTPEITGNLVLLAQDQRGWTNLCNLSSLLQNTTGEAIQSTELAMFSQGLLCLSGGWRGLAAGLLAAGDDRLAEPVFEFLQSTFPDRLYLELQTWDAPSLPGQLRWSTGLLRLARRRALPVLASVDVHYLHPDQAGLQRVVSAIRTRSTLQDLSEPAYAVPGSYFMDETTLLAALARLPLDDPQGLLNTSLEAAESCMFELPVGEHHYPEIDLPPGQDSAIVLRQRAWHGALKIYGELTPEIETRLEHELATIQACGYSSLFLIMEEILSYARRAGVPVSSRGSAASSLVAHCLGITSPDPIRLNLYFERFLNPMRATPPDIDTDLCSRRRDLVIRFVYEHFGQDKVAMVATINRYRGRSALREVAKAHGLSPVKVSSMLEKLPYRWFGPPGREENPENVYADLLAEHPAPEYQAIFHDAQSILGIPRHLSIHPGGIVIAPAALTNFAPLLLAPKGIRITQFDLVSIERLGLLKIDLLGIRGLTVLGDVAEAILLKDRREHLDSGLAPGDLPRVDYSGIIQGASPVLDVLEAIPHSDPLTEDTLLKARTIGCFQIESPGMRATLKEIQARSVDDIMVALALYRPGPLTGGLKDAFVERYRAHAAMRQSGLSNDRISEEQFYLHPTLEPLLKETFGVILYQEQVLRIAHELAGFSLSDADLLRRAMSHFDLDKQMIALREKFLHGARARSGVPEEITAKIWELMAAFAGYGFPKAHAASYAEVAWRAAWCKSHYPAVFMASVLANWGGYYSQRVYLTEARRMGLIVKAPLVNYAQSEFSLATIQGQPALVMGLGQVRELTHRTIRRIQEERPFNSLSDFLVRVDPKPVEAQNLARAGALEEFGQPPALLRSLSGGARHSRQMSLFPDYMLSAAVPGEFEEWTLADAVAAQEEILGASVAAHPLDLAALAIAASGALTTVDAAARVGQGVRVAGMRQTWRRSRAAHGEPIYFMSLEDLEGMLNVAISAAVYQKYRRELTGPGPYIVEGMVDLHPSTEEPTIRASRIERI